MNEVDAVAVVMMRKDLLSTRMRRAGVAGTRSAMLLLAVAGALVGARVARADGVVVAWGDNSEGQCNTPPELGVVTAIAAGNYHTVALKADGAVVAWGYNFYGQRNTPPGIGVVTAIAAGGGHTVAITCTTPTLNRTSNNLGPIGSGSPREFTFLSLPPTASSVSLTIRVRADLNLATEFLSVRLDGAAFTTIFVATGNDCPVAMDEVVLSLTAKEFNALTSDGALTVRLEASTGVNAAQCVDGACEISLFYESVPVDCNSNGMEDSCEVTMSGADCNSNGVPDSCDIASNYSTDINANARPDECEYDCNGNDLPDTYEIALLLQSSAEPSAISQLSMRALLLQSSARPCAIS